MVEINNCDDLKGWLEGKSSSYSVVIASRIALRVLPFVEQIFKIDFPDKRKLTKDVFKANLISWVAGTIPTHDVTNVAMALRVTTYSQFDVAYTAYNAADVGVSSPPASAAARAARAAVCATGAPTVGAAGGEGAPVVRAAYAEDINLLEQGMKPKDLVRQPLWLEGQSKLFEDEWQELKHTLLALEEGWEVWVEWYEDILAGRNWAGLPDDLLEKLAIKIVEQENNWWEQDAAIINADIKQWRDVAEEEAQERKEPVSNYLDLAIKMASPVPLLNDKNQLDITSNTEINDPVTEEGLHLLPERARRQINNLLKAFEKTNVSPILKGSLENYANELDQGFGFEITYLDDDMAIIRSERDADNDKIWCEAGVETAINKLSEIHDEIQRHYPLDLEREKYIEQFPINSERFDSEEYKKTLEEFVKATEAAYEDGKVTKEYLEDVKRQERQYKDIATLYPTPEIVIPTKDQVNPEKVKKRFLFRVLGFGGGTLGVVHKVSSILDSEAVKNLLSFAQELIEDIIK